MGRNVFWLALALACAAPDAGAQVYKWVDDKGVTHFSEIPPAEKGPRAQPNARPSGAAPAAAKSSANAKAAPVPELPPWPVVPRDLKSLYDRNLLAGSWSTPLNEKQVQIVIVFTPIGAPSGSELVVGQRWIRSGKMSFKSGVNYTLSGNGTGTGTLQASDPGITEVPARLSYAVQGTNLTLTVNGGQFDGQYRLSKQ